MQESEQRERKKALMQRAEDLRKEINKARANARGKSDESYIQKMRAKVS